MQLFSNSAKLYTEGVKEWMQLHIFAPLPLRSPLHRRCIRCISLHLCKTPQGTAGVKKMHPLPLGYTWEKVTGGAPKCHRVSQAVWGARLCNCIRAPQYPSHPVNSITKKSATEGLMRCKWCGGNLCNTKVQQRWVKWCGESAPPHPSLLHFPSVYWRATHPGEPQVGAQSSACNLSISGVTCATSWGRTAKMVPFVVPTEWNVLGHWTENQSF